MSRLITTVELLRRYAKNTEVGSARKKLTAAAGKRKGPDLRADHAKPPETAEEKLGPAAITELVASYLAGVTAGDLAKKYKINKGAVLRILRTEGVPLRLQPMTVDEATEAVRLYQRGWSLAKVGAKFDRQPTVIRNILKAAGIPRRDTHGRPQS